MRVLLGLFALCCGPAFAQISLVGDWGQRFHEDAAERGPGPELGDYLGLPITDAARLRADSWEGSRLTLPEQQCRAHVSPYINRGPLELRIWEEKDPESQQVVAIKMYSSTYEQTRTIWMDGRAHPPDGAQHTWMGFSTGKWEGSLLTVYTTHIKQGWVRRNGLPESDQATLVDHFTRHGEVLTHISIVTDPVYLTEPLIKTNNFALDANYRGNWLWPCESVVEIASRARGTVPHILPGKNTFILEFLKAHPMVPAEAARGGAETMYPEYQAKLRQMAKVAGK